MDIVLRHDEILRKAAVRPRADRPSLRAKVHPSLPTVAAGAACRGIRLAGDAITDPYPLDPGTDFSYLTTDFVAQYHGWEGAVLVVVNVEVGAADAGGFHRDLH